jgi:methionyl-tRNA formyltransferase
MPLNIVFAGTPIFAARHLDALIGSGHNIIGVYTQPDRRAGRGKKLLPSAVKQLATDNSIPVYQPASLKDPLEQQRLDNLKPDIMVVVAYGLILPQAILDTPRLGCINVHASLLPRWRGAAPIERALLAGDTETGVTIMQMDKGLDTGNMLFKTQVDIGLDIDRQRLEDSLATSGANALIYTLDNIEQLSANAQEQDDSQSTYASKLAKNEALVNWNQNAETVNRTVRCGIGRTPAYSFINDERIRIIKAFTESEHTHQANGTILTADKNGIRVACDNSVLNIEIVQLPGKNPVSAAEIINSRKALFSIGSRFGNGPEQ